MCDYNVTCLSRYLFTFRIAIEVYFRSARVVVGCGLSCNMSVKSFHFALFFVAMSNLFSCALFILLASFESQLFV